MGIHFSNEIFPQKDIIGKIGQTLHKKIWNKCSKTFNYVLFSSNLTHINKLERKNPLQIGERY